MAKPDAASLPRLLVFSVLLSLGVAASAAEPESSLFDRLGGVDAIRAVVDSTVANAVADDRINSFLAGADEQAVATLKGHLVDLICREAGGSCTYTGRDMRTAHTGLGLTDAHFDALVEDIVKALDQHGVPQAEKDDLLAILGAMRNDVLGR